MNRPVLVRVEEEKNVKSITDESNHEYSEPSRINKSEKEIPLAQDKRPNYID